MKPDSAAATIETHGLTRRFGSFTAVDHLDLAVQAGAVCGLLGANGAGKTTTIRMLTTLLRPGAGDAQVAGFDIRRAPREVRQHIGYVPQMISADGALSGRENLMLSASLYSLPSRQRRDRVAEALDDMGLAGVADHLVRTYSGGMIRRLELAQAMLHQPRVLFLDEPTIGLDPVARRTFREQLAKIHAESGMTILLSTHDMDEADALCTMVAMMHQGRLVATGTPDALKAAVGPDATLEDVFAHFSGGAIEPGGGYRDVQRVRGTAHRLG
ncbi:MAG: ABC transporter ATP-binding protein [Planctomycetota bacterium]